MRRWNGLLVATIALLGVVGSDRLMMVIVSPFGMIDERGMLSGFDGKLADTIADDKALILLQQQIDNSPASGRLTLRRKQLELIKKISSASDTTALSDYTAHLEGFVEEFAKDPAAAGDILTAIEKGAFKGDPDRRRRHLRTLRDVILARQSSASLPKLLAILATTGETELRRETYQLGTVAFPTNIQLMGGYINILRGEPTTPERLEEANRLQARLEQYSRTMDFQRRVLGPIGTTFDKEGRAAAELVYQASLEACVDTLLRIRVMALWADLLLRHGFGDELKPLLPPIIDEQHRLLATKEFILPDMYRAWLLAHAFCVFREEGDLARLEKITDIANACLPVYHMWFDGELWVARGMQGPPPKPVTHIPYADASQLVFDGRADEPVWAETKPAGGPFFFYATSDRLAEEPEVRTRDNPEIRLFHDGAWLYLHITVPEPNMKGLVTEGKAGDVFIWKDDSFELYISSSRKIQDYRQFQVNCAGESTFIVLGMKVINDGIVDLFPPDAIRGAETEIIAVHRTPKSWSIEMKVPFSFLDVTMPADGSPAVAGLAMRTHRRAGGGTAPALTSWVKMVKGPHYQNTRGYGIFEPLPRDR